MTAPTGQPRSKAAKAPLPVATTPTATSADASASDGGGIDVHGITARLQAKKLAAAAHAPGGSAPGSMGGPGNAAELQPATSEHFARSVGLMSVAHIARGVGFDAIQRSAGDALVEVLAQYIQRIGSGAKDIAEHAGRTQPRATDVLLALDDMLPAPVALVDLLKALETAKRPFPRDVPEFPARRREAANAVTAAAEQSKQIGNREELPAHVPSFVPPLPPRHTYSTDSRVVVERERDHKRTRLDMLGQKSQVQQSLHGLEMAFGQPTPTMAPQQQAWSAFQGPSSVEQASGNPFVRPPVVRGAGTNGVNKKTVFGAPDRDFAPTVNRDRAPKKHTLDTTSTLPKPSSQELGKEEKILTGTFHDGDSE